jgi:predicted amidohydrolase YtcJ
VTRAELVLALAALESAGVERGDRIEHASVAPPELVKQLAERRIGVVTQPGFIHERGDAYLTDVEPSDVRWLYRGRGFLDAGVPLGGGSDAPFGEADPWIAMRAAVDRRSAGGDTLCADEALSPEEALALFTSSPDAPGGSPRRVEVGAPADLCLLDRPWSHARRTLSRDAVRATWIGGTQVHRAD